MRVLLDTHLLLWYAYNPKLLPKRARRLFAAPVHTYVFSVVSIWEIAIKQALRKTDFLADAAALREGLLAGGVDELPVLSSHAIAVGHLPLLHRDPFDRLLIAQALTEGFIFATVDETLAKYSAHVQYVG